MNWYIQVLKKYAVFSGRAMRKEYWFFVLFNIIISIVLAVIDVATGSFNEEVGLGLLGGIYGLAVFIPAIAVLVRRLHDTDRSAWWLLIALVPLVGPIVLIVFLVLDSTPGQNRFGSNPMEASGRADGAPASSTPIRDYRVLFDLSRYGMNWMIAGAYVAAGLIGLLTLPLAQALFTGEFNFGNAKNLPVMFIGLAVGGIGLAMLLHRMKSAWQVVVLFPLIMVLWRILMGAAGVGFGETSLFDPAQILGTLSFFALFCAGLLVGIRFGGPTFLGFSLGIGAGQLINALFLNPLVLSVFRDIPLSAFLHTEGLAMHFLSVSVDAAVTGALLWWACGWHLGRRELRLTPQGEIVPRAAAAGQPARSVEPPEEERWTKY